MPVVRVNCSSNAIINGTVQFIIDVSQTLPETNSTTADDSEGALRFTIAVVLVYGIGVIGLLGISARRNRRMEVMDKEVNKFIKSKLSKYEERKTRRPKTINKLISSLHSIIQTDEPLHTAMNKSRTPNHACIRNFPLNRAYTWSGKIHYDSSKLINSGIVNNPLGLHLQVHTVTSNKSNQSPVTSSKYCSQSKSNDPSLLSYTKSHKVDKKVTFTEIDNSESMLVSPV